MDDHVMTYRTLKDAGPCEGVVLSYFFKIKLRNICRHFLNAITFVTPEVPQKVCVHAMPVQCYAKYSQLFIT